APNNFSFNNIWYFSTSSTTNPYSATNITKNFDLWCCSGGNPSEANALNIAQSIVDSGFVNGSVGNFNLTSTSPARNAGTSLTTAAGSGSGSTSFAVVTASFFQDGGGGVNPDCIAVGTATNTACISSINYSTNTITLASPISWNINDPVWLW